MQVKKQQNNTSPDTQAINIAPRFSLSLTKKLIAIMLLILAIAVRYVSLRYQSADYQEFVLPWINHLKTYGFHGFADNFANYNFPYLYLLYAVSKLPVDALVAVKMISIAFDFLLAYGIFLVTQQLTADKLKAITAAAVGLFLPTVVINSSVWAQCDSIYTSFIVFAFYFILKRSWAWAWIVWGIAFSFKLQAIFFLPFLVYLWWANRDQRWWMPSFAVIPFAAAIVPAVLAGRSIMSALHVYAGQGGDYPNLSYNAPTFLQLIHQSNDSLILSKLFIALTGAIVIIMCILFARHHLHSRRTSPVQLLVFATLLCFTVPFLLPHIHERYFYTAEILSLILASAAPRLVPIVALTQVIAFTNYAPFLLRTGGPTIPYWLSSIVILGIILYLSRLATQPLASERSNNA